MKRKLLFAIAMLFAIVGVQKTFAQSWTPSEVGEGTFYLYNVGEKKFLTSGNWWGTHAALDDDGMAVTLAGSGNTYTVSTTVVYNGKYLGDDAYMDNGTAAQWTFTKVGETNTYKLNTGDVWLVSVNGIPDKHIEAEAAGDGALWQLITKEQLIANFASATPENPVDASFYMSNPKIRRNWPITISGTARNDEGTFNAGETGLYAGGCGSLGQYHKAFDNYWAMTGVANGKYSVTVKGFNRYETGFDSPAYLYANEERGTNLPTLNDGVNDREAATRLLANDNGNKYLTDPLTVVVKDGNLRVGVKSDNNVGWATFTQFTLKMIDPYLSIVALPFTGEGELKAGQWYVYNVVSEGDYDFSTIDGIGTISEDVLLSEVNPTPLSDATVNLSEGTLFIKSEKDQPLTITPKAFVYEVGEATSNLTDGMFVQSISEITLTYQSAITNDHNASLGIVDNTKTVALYDASGTLVKTATLSSDGKVLTATFDPVVKLEQTKEYQVKIEAGIFGYAGKVTNEALTINIKAPIIADGKYYMKQADGEKYFSCGANWGSQPTVDVYGIVYELTALPDGKYTFKNVDASYAANTNLYFGTNYFTDNDKAEEILPIIITKAENGYTFGESATSYFTVNAANTHGQYVVAATEDAGKAQVWTLLSKEEYDAEIAEAQKKQYEALGEVMGLEGIVSAETMAAAVASYEQTAITDKVANPSLSQSVEGWTIGQTVDKNGGATRASLIVEKVENDKEILRAIPEMFNCTADFYQEITGLEEGLYMVTVDAFYRVGDKEGSKRGGDKAGTTPYLYAGSNKTPLVTMEYLRNEKNGGEPNSITEAVAKFNNGSCKNTVYAYVKEGEALRIGIYNAGRINQQWIPFANFTLTRIAPKTAEVTITDAKYTAYVTEFDIDFSQTDNLVAYKVTEATKEGATLEEIDEAPKGEAVILYSDVTEDTKFTLTQAVNGAEISGNIFMAGGSKVGDGETIYALGNIEGNVGFYLVAKDITVPTTKGYLEITGGGDVKNFIPFGDGDATGIESVETQKGIETGVIYNLAGQRVVNPTNGIYIVNGKKVLINK